MVEPVLFILAGFFAAGIAALFLGQAVWHRAVRLTTRRVLRQAPVSRADMVAAGDLIRAEYAVQTVRMERKMQALSAKTSEYLAEIGRKITVNTDLNTQLQHSRTQSENRQARIDVLLTNLNRMQEALAETLEKLAQVQDNLAYTEENLASVEKQRVELENLANNQNFEIESLRNAIDELRVEVVHVHGEYDAARANLKLEIEAREDAEKRISTAQAKVREDMSVKIGDLEAQIERLKVEKAMLEGVVSSVRARKRKAVASARAETAALFESLPETQAVAALDRPDLPRMDGVHILTNRLAARQSRKMMATAANDTSITGIAKKN